MHLMESDGLSQSSPTTGGPIIGNSWSLIQMVAGRKGTTTINTRLDDNSMKGLKQYISETAYRIPMSVSDNCRVEAD